MTSKRRSENQTATAISMSKELFEAMEIARRRLRMDRSNFIRFCVSRELERLSMKPTDPAPMERPAPGPG